MRPQATMISLATLAILFSSAGSIFAQGNDAWTEELWDDAPISSGQRASAMPDFLPFNVTEGAPQAFRLASSDINYTEYVYEKRSNELWIRDNLTWTQYVWAYQDDRIELVAYTPTGGSADLYRIYYTSGNISHKGYNLLPGYYIMNISTYEPGRTMLIFAVDNQPANAVMIDVLKRDVETESGPVSVESLLPRKARVIIQSDSVKDYDVFVDGAFYSSDIGDGKIDGTASFTVSGEGMHTVIISKRDSSERTTYESEHKRYFKGGYTYTLKA